MKRMNWKGTIRPQLNLGLKIYYCYCCWSSNLKPP
uniref:Uncharacterized protein n=1 Tax=Rhizophora mucronata TaxID=61149 RepID=A0A2P2Q5P3_RHIMU